MTMNRQYIIDQANDHSISPNHLTKILSAYDVYISDNNENMLNKFVDIKGVSLLLLMSFLPSISVEYNTDISIDPKTGLFGISIQCIKNNKQVLLLVFGEDDRVIFSYVTRKHGMVKISGTAYLGNLFEDSNEINKILRILD